jgi:hypothetical protein
MKSDPLLQEFRHERSVRRATELLAAKRQSIRSDLRQWMAHLNLLLPPSMARPEELTSSELIADAADRVGDRAFTELLLQLLAEDCH